MAEKKRIFTDEWRAKLRLAAKARANSPEGRLKLGQAAKGHVHSDATRQKIREAGIGRVQSDETKAKRVQSRQGYTHTDETKEKISASNAGREQTPEERLQRSAALKGRPQSPEHIAARVAGRQAKRTWFAVADIGSRISEGKKEAFQALPDDAKEPIRANARKLAKDRQIWPDKTCEVCDEPMIGYNDRRPHRRTCSRECTAVLLSGEGNANWKGGVTPESIQQRRTPEAAEWRAQVLMRDNFTCQRCGAKENLHAHHIKPWARFPELRFDITNGETLCVACHEAHHGYSLGGRTNEKYRIHLTCDWCGDDIFRKPSKVSRFNYCLRPCQNKGSSRWLKLKFNQTKS